jgi:exopolysaccharide production protein ExoZ
MAIAEIQATRPGAPGGKLAGVQAARGVAALMVVVYHTTRSLSLPQYLGHIPFANAFGFGHAGVDFFFVLSGFIITHVHSADVGRSERLYRYLWRRVTRVYPIYWFVTGLEIIHSAVAPDAAIRLAPSHLLHSLLLLPENSWPLVSVAWTLRSEILFYLIFALPIIDRRFSIPLITGALLLVFLGPVSAAPGAWTDLLVSPFNIEFLIGIAVAKLLANREVPHPGALVVAGIVFFLAVGAMEVLDMVPLNGLIGRLLYGGASAAILLGLVEMERLGRLRLGIAGVMLGESSYCLYLIHLTIVPIAVRVCAGTGLLAMLPVSTIVAALVAMSVFAAVTLHVGVELPLMAFIRNRTPRICR